MSSKTENFHRNATPEKSDIDDLDYFIVAENLPIEAIYQSLRNRGKSEKEIEDMIDKIKDARDGARRVVRKFLAAVNARYGHLDIPEMIKKGMKHADKYGLTKAQKEVFRNNVMKGDVYNNYSMSNELRYTDMAKFLGFDAVNGYLIKIQPKDHSKLNELHMLYDASKHIHADVKNQLFNYRDCAPEALTGAYDRNKHNVSVYIHPVVAALFLPKVEYIERRMLYTNIARMVLSRGQAYLKNTNLYVSEGIAPGELDAEYELAHDIAHDPNALAHLADDHPIDNIIKRFRVQIELWQNVINLRQGRYYSTGYDANDGISGLSRVINSYEWTFFDSPDLFHVQDEGTILRKLLAVFSCRPTFTQLSDFSARYGMGLTTVTGLARTTFVNIPIVNIKLPIDLIGNARHQINLVRALSQTDNFIENRMIVPKNKSVIYSNEVAFFYANRRYPSINFNHLNVRMRNVHLPTSFLNTTSINNTMLVFEPRFRIGRDLFDLRSVVMLQRPPISGINVIAGCTAAIAVPSTSPTIAGFGFQGNLYAHYNPQLASMQIFDPNATGTTNYVANTPVTYIDEYQNDPAKVGFRNEAQERGTIFFYTKA